MKRFFPTRLLFAALCLALVAAVSTEAQAGKCKKQAAAAKHKSHGTELALAPAKADDIVTTAVNAGSFKTLAKALTAADLVETLQGKGPFTVFAPTDAAFAKLPEGTLESLLNDIPKLKAILTYHVVPGKVMAADVVKLKKAKTVQGSEVTIDATDGVKVDAAKVVKTDIACSNGVIHVIDAVILPKE